MLALPFDFKEGTVCGRGRKLFAPPLLPICNESEKLDIYIFVVAQRYSLDRPSSVRSWTRSNIEPPSSIVLVRLKINI